MNVLRQQESVEGFPGEALPSTAFYFTDRGVRTGRLYFLMEMQETGRSVPRVTCKNRDRELSRYLMENAGQDLVACLFQREDTLQDAAAVLSLSVSDVTEAERMLRALYQYCSCRRTGKNTPDNFLLYCQ